MFTHNHAKLDAIERVRSALKDVAGEKITVPGIAVVGAQSSGKSSVLEHATGLAFPRGEGMCTRVPTIVSIEYVGEEATSITVATDASYTENAQTVDPENAKDFASAIEEATSKITKEGEIGEDPIYVKFKRSGTGPAFTLTDVPGITCISKTQSDVETRTTNLTRKLIANNEDTLILVVLPATDDFTNSKALKIAGEEDPEGKRTIGVVTKVDNLPPGSDLDKRMTDGEIDLLHGFYAVRNRTQEEVNNGVSIDELGELESDLFKTDSVLSQLPASHCGMKQLVEKLCEEQTRSIEESIPKIKCQINDRLRKQQTELAKLPGALVSDTEKSMFILGALSCCWNDLRRCSEADTTVLGTTTSVTNLSARAHESINFMTEELRRGMPNFLDECVKIRLLSSSKEALGYDLSHFIQGPVFREEFSKAIYPNFQNNAERAVDAVSKCVEQCMAAIFSYHFSAQDLHTSVLTELQALVKSELDRRVDATKALVSRLSEAEKRCTYTNNHYLTQTISKFRETIIQKSSNWSKGHDMDNEDEGELIPSEFLDATATSFRKASNEEAAVREMQITLHAYSKVVNKRFTDSVAILVLNELIYTFVDDSAKLSVAWMPSLLEKLSEHKSVALRRKELKKSIAGLTVARTELQAM
jgi:energy-coupling factor transporter ATP-binding protein EcfA2